MNSFYWFTTKILHFMHIIIIIIIIELQPTTKHQDMNFAIEELSNSQT